MGKPIDMLCIYRPKKGKDEDFLKLLRQHWPVLRKLGLATEQPAKAWRAETKSGTSAFIESFQWADAKAPEIAHQTPEVMKIWEPMGPLVDGMEFLQVEPVKL
jgi:hypothetical protein